MTVEPDNERPRQRDDGLVDVDEATRDAVEFDQVLETLAALAATPAGAERLRQLRPSTDPSIVADRHAAVGETRALLVRDGRLVPFGLPDVRQAAARLSVAGERLDAKALRDVATVLDAASAVGRRLRRAAASDPVEGIAAPQLGPLGEDLPDLSGMTAPILAGIEPDGQLADDASPELRRIRRDRVRVGERLRDQLGRKLRDPDRRSAIRDDFVTERNGRFVIPVRSDSHRGVEGIVHASSSSGATQFVEPLDVVPLNNQRVQLSEAEREEIDRLLAVWTESLRVERASIDAALAALAVVDGLQARGLWANERGAVAPEVVVGGELAVRGARHPLLDDRLKEAGESTVPLDLALDPADRVLVVSGPNAGGKTVALKTIGLFTLLAQSGVPLPAREVKLPLYRQVRADVGDHQSIAADLSTFSAHLTVVGRAVADVRSPALFLFDEICSGTEPGEGEALAQAILEELRRDGVTVIVTTHLGALKRWSMTAERVVPAAMEFDPERLRPTFRIQVGAVGQSAGLSIARRMGLASRVLERARELVGAETSQGEAYLAELQRLRDAAAAERERLVEEQDGLVATRARLEREALDERDRRRSEAAEDADRWREEMSRKLDKELKGIREATERARAEKAADRGKRRLAAQALDRARRAKADRPPTSPDGSIPEVLEPGARVFVDSLGRVGEVRQDRGSKVTLDVGGLGITVPRSDLRPESSPTAKASTAAAAKPQRRYTAEDDLDSRDTPAELVLIGLRVDEAEDRMDAFLDQASLGGLREVRLVHGHGTGRLREAVRRFLSAHAQVASWRKGAPNEGGDGATIASVR